MAKKLTDKAVAKALGWKKQRRKEDGESFTVWLTPARKFYCRDPRCLPPFTTSLDAIVAEVEARGLFWVCHSANGANLAEGRVGPTAWATAKTAPLALCAALLAYLKEGSHD